MKLSCVMVSVDYGDFLAATLPLNLNALRPDQMMVVTSPEDVDTQRICRYYGVPHAQTDVFRTRWNEMHKAKGINVGLKQLAAKGGLGDWVLHMDADMVLPPMTRGLIERANLDRVGLYGIDRYVVPGFDAWQQFMTLPALQQDNYHVHMDHFPIAPRFSGARMGGYAPPGYFQLWNAKTRGITTYPDEHTSAAKTDVLHTAQWRRNTRAVLPEFLGYHLESEAAAQGANWSGRQTARWGPQPDRGSHHDPHHHRPPPHHHHHHPYGNNN